MHYPAFINFLLWMLIDFTIRTCRSSQLPDFQVSFFNKCWPNDSYFTRRFGISLQQCVKECDNRRKCKSINYRRKVQLCELIPTTADFDDDDDTDGRCTIVHMKDVHRNDIKSQNNCYSSCTEHEVCNPETGTCSVEVPFSITNGTFLGNMNVIGSRVKFTCNIGTREKNGKSISECQKNGNWSVFPQCIIVCVSPSVIDNSFFPPGEYIPGETIHYNCADNYDTTDDVSNMRTTCLEDRSWSPTKFTCIRVCGDPSEISNSNIEDGGHLFSDKRQYRCAEGYGTLSYDVDMVTTCLHCGSFGIANGIARVDKNTYVPNTATITCNCGYKLHGTDTLTCTPTGWDKAFPTCIAWNPQCSEGFKLYCDSCYLFDKGRYNWEDAGAKCEENDGHLVHVDNQAENDWLASQCQKYTSISLFWINLSDNTVEGKWIWNDTNTEAIYTPWGNDEPNGGNRENCASIQLEHNYQWADLVCGRSESAICEKDPIADAGEDTLNNA